MIVSGYHILERLYESTTSQVYRARRASDNQLVILKALKQIHPSPKKIAWFKREYEMTRALNCAGVVEVYSLENNQGRWMMLLEDFGGESLEQLKLAGTLTISEFLRLAIAVTDILDQIHQQHIMHKDINPSNIVLNPTTGQLKMIDFGISTMLSRENPTFRNPAIMEGTLAYMSPEQTGRMNRAMDYRTDFYSLGVTFYELLTRQLPFPTHDALELVHSHMAKQPIPPHQLKPSLPSAISEIVLKLMIKNAEDRYQSAYGLKADLAECLWQWQATRRVDPFPLGQKDMADQFQPPQKLYGREKEIKTLLATFDRVIGRVKVAGRPPPRGQVMKEKLHPRLSDSQSLTRSLHPAEMLLVSGYAGIGKSALVQEVYRPLTQQRGYFIAGKFDQFQRNIPYAAFIQAFRTLMQQLLTENEVQAAIWRQKLLAALAPNGQVIIDVIPELALIIGPQPEVPPLAPTEAQNRFNLTFHNFIQVFTQPEHPLVLFLDDLQWGDGASLKLINLLMTTPNRHYLFLIGAYRNNEVSQAHPLHLTLAELEQAGATLQHLILNPLELPDVTQWVADTLHHPPGRVNSLAGLILTKTQGNPLFINEFLKSLYAEQLLRFDGQRGEWQWDVAEIQKWKVTDNVIELMASRVEQLRPETQAVLKLAACIGNQFDLETLAVVYEKSSSHTATDLWEALAEGIILPLSDTYRLMTLNLEGLGDELKIEYKFAHDRLRQAVYSLIPEQERPVIHRCIGQLLWQRTTSDKLGEGIFDIVNQLNLSLPLITQPVERDQLAELNLLAGQKAKASAAYEPALNYFKRGLELLGLSISLPNLAIPANEPLGQADPSWQRQYHLTLNLHIEAAQAAYLTGDFEGMEQLTEVVLQWAENLLDKVKIYEVKIQAYIAQHKLLEAVQTALPVLKLLGVKFPDRPGKLHALQILPQTRLKMIGKHVEDLVNLPEMTDPYKLAAIRILSSVHTAAYFAMPALVPLEICTRVNLSIQYGNAPVSAFAYADYGLLLCGVLGKIELGYRFGQLALKLVAQREAKEVKAKTLLVVNAHIRHWQEHVKDTLPSLLEAYQSGLETGDLEFAAVSAGTYAYTAYYTGQELIGLAEEMAKFSLALTQLKQEPIFYYNGILRQMILNLLEPTKNPSHLRGEAYNEENMLPLHLAKNDRTGLSLFYNAKLFLCYLFELYPQAVENAASVEKYLDGIIGLLLVPLFHFYDSLARLALYPQLGKFEKKHSLGKVTTNQKRLKKWADHAPMNHLHKYHLVEAERARVLGQEDVAKEHYRQAIVLAQENEYVNEAALAYELAAKFYLGQGMESVAQTYMAEARYAYLRWGALAKVKHLDETYPHLLAHLPLTSQEDQFRLLREGIPTTMTTRHRHSETLDLNTVLKASEFISAETRLDSLLEKLIKLAIEHAGAQKGLLLLERAGRFVIEVEGTVQPEGITVHPATFVEPHDPTLLPMTLINYIARTEEYIILEDATHRGPFTYDPYIMAHQPKSILCLPLIHQGYMRAILYLENNLASGVFTPERVDVLKLITSQGAISIENAILAGRRHWPEAAPAPAPAKPAVGIPRSDTPPLSQDPTTISIPETGETLTAREVEILELIAAGSTNRAIGEQLVISMPTVKTHITHILSKLNVTSRAEAVARAQELGIIIQN